MRGTAARRSRPGKAYRGLPMEGIIAWWYARVRAGDPQVEEAARDVAAALPDGGRVLEIAPGPGALAITLARRGYEVTGLDISHSFVRMASAAAAEAGVSADFRHGNASQMPFAEGSFDLTVCHAAFKNFTEPVEALREMHRVLRPGGVAIIGDLRRDASTIEIDAHIRGMGLKGMNAALTRQVFRRFLLKNAYSATDIRGMVEGTDFSDCDIREAGISLDVRLRR